MSRAGDHRIRVSLLLTAIMVLGVMPIASATDARASGIDVRPTAAVVEYVSSSDATQYAALSSPDPSSIGLTRPAGLWIVDGMLGAQMRISVTIENLGSTNSGSFNVDCRILHNEYSSFELHTYTQGISDISGGNTHTFAFTWVPDYSGNHTVEIITLHTSDDDTSNDRGTRSLTIGNLYDRAETTSGWTHGNGWSASGDTSLSGSNSFHVGGSGGSTSTYGNSWSTGLESPTFDLSDAHPSPVGAAGGIGFFYTGHVLAGDVLHVDIWDGGAWTRISGNGMSGLIDDSTLNNWNIQMVGGRPYFPMQMAAANANWKFRLQFDSDASGTEIGYWVEDVVMFYDQKARLEEYSTVISQAANGHAQPGEWSSQQVTIINDGNVSDRILPTVTGLPAGWNFSFQHVSGSQLQPGTPIELDPGESKVIQVRIQPAMGAPVASQPFTLELTSADAPAHQVTRQLSMTVDPSYRPLWSAGPHNFFCVPGQSCDFQVELHNDGDAQDTFTLSSADVTTEPGWTWALDFEQPGSITVPAGGSTWVELSGTVANGAQPGEKVAIDLTATSNADPSKFATIRPNMTAAMVSDAHVAVAGSDVPEDGWWFEPGQTHLIPFTIWNNASRQDTLRFSFESTGVRGWTMSIASQDTVVISPGGTAQVILSVQAPSNAIADDPGPILLPHAVSLESGTAATNTSFAGLRVLMEHNLVLTIASAPTHLEPGVATPIAFDIENDGNGADLALITLSGAPASWAWWVEVGGANITGPLSLSSSIDGSDWATGTLWVQPPGTEEASTEFLLSIEARPHEGEESTPEDCTVQFEILTLATARPYLSAFEAEESELWVGQEMTWELNLTNDGNTFDSRARVRVLSDALHPGMIAQLSSSRGNTGQLNGWIDLPLGAGASETLTITFRTLDDFPFGTTIQLTVEAQGGWDENGNPIQVSTSHTVNVNHRRSVEVDTSLAEPHDYDANAPYAFWINASSESTMAITLDLAIDAPEGVVINCEPRAQENTVQILLPEKLGDRAVEGQIECQMTLSPSDQARTIELSMTDDQGERIWTTGPVHVRVNAVEESGSFTLASLPVMAIAGVGGFVFILFVVAMVVLIARRSRTLARIEDGEDEEPQPVAEPAAGTAPWAPPGPMPQAGPPGPMPVVEEQAAEPSPADYSDDELRASGWSDAQIAELRGEPALPTFVCMASGVTLGADQAWWQCPACQGFAATSALTGLSACPGCQSPW